MYDFVPCVFLVRGVVCSQLCVCVTLASRRLATIGLKTLMDRLTNRELYPLAIALCGFLKYSPDEGEIPVLMHWARKKVRTHPLSVWRDCYVYSFLLLHTTLSGDPR